MRAVATDNERGVFDRLASVEDVAAGIAGGEDVKTGRGGARNPSVATTARATPAIAAAIGIKKPGVRIF